MIRMNQEILNMFNPDFEDFDVQKEFEFIERVQDGELEISDYIDEFIYLLNNIYLEDGADSELELFIESVEPETLVSKVLKTFEVMIEIDTIFAWNKFLFDSDYLPYMLENLKGFDNKEVFIDYMEKSLNGLKHLSEIPVVKERMTNIELTIEYLRTMSHADEGDNHIYKGS